MKQTGKRFISLTVHASVLVQSPNAYENSNKNQFSFGRLRQSQRQHTNAAPHSVESTRAKYSLINFKLPQSHLLFVD